jgi:streptogramin lyase
MISRRNAVLLVALLLGPCVAGRAQSITEFALPDPASGPSQIAAGSDGNLWFTETNPLSPRVGRITPTGVVTEFPLPGSPFSAIDIASGPDGNLWVTIADTGQGAFAAIGRITTAGVVTLFPLPSPSSRPDSIAVGLDGALWFTETIGNRIGRITTAGVITEFPIPTAQSQPAGIAAGPDGNLWFTETAAARIGRITPAGAVTEFPIPSGGQPLDIASGADGSLWFTEISQIGRITAAGVITEFANPPAGTHPQGIGAGPDGNVWFTEFSRIGRITPAGVITDFAIPSSPGDAQGITAGPDDAMWFAETAGNRIGRITTRIVDEVTLILPVVGSTAGVGGSFFRTSVQLHNSGTTPSVGGIVFHPSGVAGSVQDRVLTFSLAPGETQTIPDLLPAMGLSGLGSADVILTLGSAGNVPVVSARVFNDAGAAGTTGFALNALLAEDALHAGHRGVLFVPADLTAFRLNLGVRTLNEDVALTLTVRNAEGAVAAVVPKFFPAVYHEQRSAEAFLNGLALPAGGSITVLVESGGAILYGATVDNRTGDPSLQIARAVP